MHVTFRGQELKVLRLCLVISTILCCFLIHEDECYAADNVLRVGVSCQTPPYQFLNENDKPVGIHIELMDEIAARLGYETEYVLADGNVECYEMLASQKVDVVLGVNNDTRYKDKVLFTNEITASSICILASSDYEGKDELIGAFEYKTAGLSDLKGLHVTEGFVVANQKGLIDSLLSGEVDVVAGVKDSLVYTLHKRGLHDEYRIISDYINTISYYIAVRQGDNVLAKNLNGAIIDLKTKDTYFKILNKWIIDESKETLDNLKTNLRRVLITFAVIVVLAGIYIFVLTKFRAILKKQVNEKNAELFGLNKQLSKNLKRLENEIELRTELIDSSPNGMLMFDKTFCITALNKTALKIAAGSVTVGECALRLRVFGNILGAHGDTIFNESEGKRADTLQAYYYDAEAIYRYTIHQTISEEIVNGALLTVEDVTLEERKKQEVFEAEKNTALNKVIAGIAHEIKNPLMSIKTFTSMIEHKQDKLEFWESFKEFVPKEVDRINRLIVELINYARPMKVEMQSIYVDELLDDCLQLGKTASARYGDKLRIHMDVEKGLAFRGSVDNIKQVLLNLIINGVESMERKLAESDVSDLTLTLSAKDIGGYVLLTVSDEGVGMSEEELKQCMEPFYTSKSGGTGLGLAVSKQFVERNGGELRIKSVLGIRTECTLKFRRYDET